MLDCGALFECGLCLAAVPWTEVVLSAKAPCLIHRLSLQLWIANWTLTSAAQHLLVGFELGLYEPCEYSTIFAYLMLLWRQQQQGFNMLLGIRPKPDKAGKKGKDSKRKRIGWGSNASA